MVYKKEIVLNEDQRKAILHLPNCQLVLSYESTSNVVNSHNKIKKNKKSNIKKVDKEEIRKRLCKLISNSPDLNLSEKEDRSIILDHVLEPSESDRLRRSSGTVLDLRAIVTHIIRKTDKLTRFIDELVHLTNKELTRMELEKIKEDYIDWERRKESRTSRSMQDQMKTPSNDIDV
ncbi:MAG: hypothetical protein ACPGWR_06205 [Ardenticatenaceae bacterium]